MHSSHSGERASASPSRLLRTHMQAPGWLFWWREVWPVGQLSDLPRPVIGEDWLGYPCLPTCLEATIATLVTCVVFISPPLVFQSYRRKVAYNCFKR